jgi:DNA-binding MurR/RpiR family transcriptional regulator
VSASPLPGAAPGLEERIVARQHELSPQERRAAQTLLEHLDDLATYRAAELAELAGVSKATMSRLFRSLGFAGFDEVRDHLRAVRTTGVPLRTEGPADVQGHAAREAAAIAGVLHRAPVGEAVEVLASARRVLVVGWRSSHPVALHLRQQLAQVRPDVRLAPLPGQVVGEELADLRTGDVVVMVGFRRRPAGFGAALASAAASGADVVLLADPTARPHARHAAVWLECPVGTTLAFDSYAAAMSLVAVLADGVHAALGRPARARVSTIVTSYRRLGEIE